MLPSFLLFVYNFEFLCFHVENAFKTNSASVAKSDNGKFLFGISHLNITNSKRTRKNSAACVITFKKVSLGIQKSDFIVAILGNICASPLDFAFVFIINHDIAEILRISAES